MNSTQRFSTYIPFLGTQLSDKYEVEYTCHCYHLLFHLVTITDSVCSLHAYGIGNVRIFHLPIDLGTTSAVMLYVARAVGLCCMYSNGLLSAAMGGRTD
jgi:hypothetical protein